MRKFLSISKNDSIKSIAIGKFDSMHLGHKAILDNLDENGIILLIKMHQLNEFIVPYNKRQKYTKSKIYYIDFDDIKDLSGKDFLNLLQNRLINLRHIIVGSDFRFGKNRAWLASDIQKISNLSVKIINEISIDGFLVHSSCIRKCISNGDIKLANKLLGRFYSIEGKVISGQSIGGKLLFPTINIKTEKYILPQSGVYATYSKIGDCIFKSISFLGHRLSTDMNFAIETHVIDKNIENPPKKLDIFFVEKIRDNKKFFSLILLKSQIYNDINIAKNILKNCTK